MKHSIPDKVHALRTGKIKLTQGSASEILRSVGVRSSDIRVAEKAYRNLGAPKVPSGIQKADKTPPPR